MKEDSRSPGLLNHFGFTSSPSYFYSFNAAIREAEQQN